MERYPGCPPVGIPIRSPARRDAPRAVQAGVAEGLLLVAHGSACALNDAGNRRLGELVAAASPGVAVEVGYLEMTDPSALVALESLAARGCRRVVVLPLVLLGAGHAKSDVPAVVASARERHPDLEVRLGAPLGVAREPVELLGQALLGAGARGLPLLLVARGSSDPDSNSDAHKAARLLAEWIASPFVHVGFSGVTGPSLPEALEVFERLGQRRLALAWWYLGHGRLVERGRAQVKAFSERTGVEVLDAGHLGPHPRLVPLVLRRYQEALEGQVAASCDLCAYRAPWPGLERRVGQPVGVGHSHLAAAHLHPAPGRG